MVPGEIDPPLTIKVLPTTKVKDVKVLLRVNHGMDCHRVYFQGYPLDDLSTLQENHVVKGCTLHLVRQTFVDELYVAVSHIQEK